jgi:hypothetical protein
MATIKWLVGSGTWNTAAKWSPNSVPGPTDDAVVDAAGSYTVTIDAPAIDVGRSPSVTAAPPWWPITARPRRWLAI